MAKKKDSGVIGLVETYKFDVIKSGVATFKDQILNGVPKGAIDRNVYINALRNWDNLLSPEKIQWMNNFDFLYIKHLGYMIAKNEIAHSSGHEILAGIRYDDQGRLMSYSPAKERDY